MLVMILKKNKHPEYIIERKLLKKKWRIKCESCVLFLLRCRIQSWTAPQTSDFGRCSGTCMTTHQTSSSHPATASSDAWQVLGAGRRSSLRGQTLLMGHGWSTSFPTSLEAWTASHPSSVSDLGSIVWVIRIQIQGLYVLGENKWSWVSLKCG